MELEQENLLILTPEAVAEEEETFLEEMMLVEVMSSAAEMKAVMNLVEEMKKAEELI